MTGYEDIIHLAHHVSVETSADVKGGQSGAVCPVCSADRT